MASLDMDCIEFDRIGAEIESQEAEHIEVEVQQIRLSEQDVHHLLSEDGVETTEAPEIVGEVKMEKDEDLHVAVIVQPNADVGLDPSMLASGTTRIVHLGSSEAEHISLLTDSAQLLNGQIIQLPDGRTAVVQHGFQMIQLPDGNSALLPAGLFADIGSQLTLEQVDEQLEEEEEEGEEKEGEPGGKKFRDFSDVSGDVLDSKLLSENRRRQISEGMNDIGTADEEGILARHLQRTTGVGMGKIHRCSYESCDRVYTTYHHLKVHMRSHTGDRPFQCDFDDCNKAFATGYGLKSHRRIHTGEKPYPCINEQCDKAFKTSGDLQKHMRTHTGERPFLCPYKGCNRSFTTSNIRKVHIRTHTGERPYTCDVKGCGKTFASATNYKNHIRIHSGEKPYECSVQGCGKRFTEYSSLYKHHVVHTYTKPYPCELCGKTYRQTSTLAMHRRMAHGEENGAGEAGDFVSVLVGTSNQTACAKQPTTFRLVETGCRGPDDADGNLVIDTSEVNQGSSTSSLLQQLPSAISISGSGTGSHVLVITDPSQLEVIKQISERGN